MKVGIAIDNWKFAIFERHLKMAGYVFKKLNGLTPGTMLLAIETTNAQALAQVILKANQECAKTKAPK